MSSLVDRGQEFAELERCTDELERSMEQLKKAGYTLREFARLLETDPTGIVISDYPGYLIYGDEASKTPWEYPNLKPIFDLDTLVGIMKKARELKRRKAELEKKLGKKLLSLDGNQPGSQ